MTACRACNLPILFVTMRTGTPMPVDPVPDDRGNVQAMRDNRGRWIDGHVIDRRLRSSWSGPPDGYSRLMPHFATCAAATKRGTPRPPETQPSLLEET